MTTLWVNEYGITLAVDSSGHEHDDKGRFAGKHSWKVVVGSEGVPEHFHDPDVIHAQVHHPDTKKRIGIAQFRKTGNGKELFPESVFVDQEHRRKGIATAIYKHVEKLGYTIKSQPGLSKEGEKFRKTYEKRRNISMSTDSSGHEHRGKGPGGGQFVGKGDKPKSNVKSAVANLKAARKAYEKAKEQYREVFSEAQEAARNHLKDLGRLASDMRSNGSDQMAWDGDAEDHQAFTEIDTLLYQMEDEESYGSMREYIDDLESNVTAAIEVNKTLRETSTDPNDMEWDKLQKDNADRLQYIQNGIKSYKKTLKKYAQARRDMKAIREGMSFSLDDFKQILDACLAESNGDMNAALEATEYILSQEFEDKHPRGEGGEFVGKAQRESKLEDDEIDAAKELKLPTYYNGKDDRFAAKNRYLAVNNPLPQSTIVTYEDVRGIPKEILNDTTTQEMKIVDLRAAQDYVRPSAVKSLIDGGLSSDPIVASIGEEFVLINGNHNTLAAKLKGESTIRVRYAGEIKKQDGNWVKVNPTLDKSLSVFLAHDIHNRKAQGILNRAMKAARKMSAEAADELGLILKRGVGVGEGIVDFIQKYRTRMARILTTTQLASLLEGAREVANKVPPLGEVPIEGLPIEEQERILAAKDSPTFNPKFELPTPNDDIESVHFPIIDEAVKNLQERNVIDRPGYDALDAAARAKAFTVANVAAEETLTKIRDSLSKNVREGVDFETWSKKVMEDVGAGTFMSDAHQENVFRTNVQTAFSDGQATVLSHPLVRSGFPYSSYDAIHDNRVRENHAALEKHGIDGTNIYRNDDPVFQMFRPPWDYNDRCGWTPITVRQAAERGIPEAQQWLKTGVEPADKSHVVMPPFEPPEGFRRSIATAPLSIQLSLQPVMSFSTDASGHKHKGKGEGGGQFTSSGGSESVPSVGSVVRDKHGLVFRVTGHGKKDKKGRTILLVNHEQFGDMKYYDTDVEAVSGQHQENKAQPQKPEPKPEPKQAEPEPKFEPKPELTGVIANNVIVNNLPSKTDPHDYNTNASIASNILDKLPPETDPHKDGVKIPNFSYSGKKISKKVDDLLVDTRRKIRDDVKWANLEKEVPLSSIVVTQTSVSKVGTIGYVKEEMPDVSSMLRRPMDRPTVFKDGDKYYLADGHHKLVASLLRGKEKISVYVLSYKSTGAAMSADFEYKHPRGEGGEFVGKNNAVDNVEIVQRSEDILSVAENYFGKEVTLSHMAQVVGAPNGSTVTLVTYGNQISIAISHPKFYALRRLDIEDGKKVIKNDQFYVKKEYQNQGIGADIFSKQVEMASKSGFDYIECTAGRKKDGSENGYYTWPRFGYDLPLSELSKKSQVEIKRLFPNSKSVLDVMSTENGRDWWKQNGSKLSGAKFDLRDGSRSMEIHSAYLEERSKRGKK